MNGGGGVTLGPGATTYSPDALSESELEAETVARNTMNEHPVVRAFLVSAAEELGAQCADALRQYLAKRLHGELPMGTTLTVTSRETDQFLSNGPYATFVADKVIRDALTRFSLLPAHERQVVLAENTSSHSDPGGIVRDIVAYMRRR